ncbi:MAG TPA: Fic family protein [Acetobacteraceae bacterium]|nr:Fic family protein [Acetobacteraceae bacterium]
MNPKDFEDPRTGKLVPTTNGCMAFIPAPLPPENLDLESLVPLIARATRALGELSGVGRTLPNPYLLIRPFMRKEAAASSKIEGTVTTLSELLLFEADEQTSRAPSDAREVLNYVRALEHALKRLDELPISRRLIQEAHSILMLRVASHRGARITPGEFRRDQNWIGARLIENARFVPPPTQEVDGAISDLEKYINNKDDLLPMVIKMALVHYQFETIHPFPDGNGRVGRMLMPLMLCESKELSQPLLYLSSYLEKNYDTYIDRMFAVSTRGRWEEWIGFFLSGLAETCMDAIAKAQALQDLQNQYLGRIQQARSSALLAKIIGMIFESPAVTIPSISSGLGISYNSAKKHVARLEEHEILFDSAYGRPKIWFAREVVDLVNK